jgi:SAM-dependent methyltransferase
MVPREPGDTRSAREIRRHYEVEKELAAQLRNSSREERTTLYASLYTDLITSQVVLPTHPPSATSTHLRMIDRFLDADAVFLEIGAGDCALSLAVAERVRRVYAIEVSTAITAGAAPLENLEILITDGLDIPVPPNSVTLAYSNQVLEHLHPDDVVDHFRDVYTALAPGGRYVCITPNRLIGPADVSKYFDPVPTGFHLREYTAGEVASLMQLAGFDRVEAWTTRKGISVRVPWWLVNGLERTLSRLPRTSVRRMGRALPLRIVLGCYVVGVNHRQAPS